MTRDKLMRNDDTVEKFFNRVIHTLYPEIVTTRSQLSCSIYAFIASVGITLVDVLAPAQISFRNMLVIPVIMVSFTENRKIIYLFIGINAFLLANAVGQTIPQTSPLPPLVNFLSAFVAYIFVSETILLGLGTINTLGKKLTTANQQIAEYKKMMETVKLARKNNHAGHKIKSPAPRQNRTTF